MEQSSSVDKILKGLHLSQQKKVSEILSSDNCGKCNKCTGVIGRFKVSDNTGNDTTKI